MFISYSYLRFSKLVFMCSTCISVTLSLFVFVTLCVFVSHPCCETKRHWRPFPWPLPWWEASLVHQEAQALSQGMFSKISSDNCCPVQPKLDLSLAPLVLLSNAATKHPRSPFQNKTKSTWQLRSTSNIV